MPSIPIRLVQPHAGSKTVTVFMVAIGVTLLVSSGQLRTSLDWLRSKTAGAGLIRNIPNATAIQNQVPVPGSPGHTTTPSGNYTTTFGP